MGSILGSVRTPDGDTVVLTVAVWDHILARHPEMDMHRGEIFETISSPHLVTEDPEAGRKRFYRSGVGPSRWLRVIVDFNQRPARIISAFGIRKERPT